MSTRPSQAAMTAHFEQALSFDSDALYWKNTAYFRPTEDMPRPLVRASADLYNTAVHKHPSLDHDQINAVNAHSATLADTKDPLMVHAPSFALLSTAHTSMCADAELHFNYARRQMFAPVNPLYEHSHVSVYHDQHGSPIFLRKRWNASTALALVAMRLEGSDLDIPAGTIVNLGTFGPEEVTAEKTVISPQSKRTVTLLRLISFDAKKDSVMPLRHSAWAYTDPLDRALFATAGEHATIMSQDRLDMLTDYSLEDYRALSSRLAKLCLSDAPGGIKAPALAR